MDAVIMGGLIAGGLSLTIAAFIAYSSHANPGDTRWLMHDGPLLLMYLVGTWIFIPLGLVWAISYAALAVMGNL